jgi:hypothetical protein
MQIKSQIICLTIYILKKYYHALPHEKECILNKVDSSLKLNATNTEDSYLGIEFVEKLLQLR